ncbi:MAG TPA: PHP domain-containing protein [Candidatus Limnocylindria bacterium]|nr:PHP domain-containing protein [Candidatus Limnocylindria bacterium]
MERVRLDMHMHTEYSRDSRVALAQFAELAREAELGAVCITDHDTIEGALRLREMNTGLQVIVGEEITTADGELVGLYLEKPVAPGLSAEHSIHLIHEQGGLAYVPHPFSRNRRRHLRRTVLERVAPSLDIVEVFNAREVASSSNVLALEFARQHSLPGGVGSDSHRPIEIGRAYVDVAPFVTPQELLVALSEGKVTGTLSGLGIHVRTWVDIGRKFMRTRVARLRSSVR